MTRNSYIDALKGAAIILVVLGHAIQFHNGNFDDNLLFRIIYSFHMAFFMFLSGLVLPSQLNLSFSGYLKKNSCRLVVPFLAWYLVGYVIARLQGESISLIPYCWALVRSPDRGLWFLWVLFISSTLLFGVIKTVRTRNLLPWENYFIIAALLVTRTFSADILALSEVKQYFIYYASGYLIYKYGLAIRGKWLPLFSTSLIAFPLLAVFWKRNAFPTFYPALLIWLNEPHLARFIVSIYRDAVAFSGIAFMSFTVDRIREWRVYTFLCWLGTMTLDIYVSHKYFLIGIGKNQVKYTSATICALTLSLGLSILVLRQIKILRLLFLGQAR